MQRFMEEVLGIEKRAFPNGRLGADDDGEFAYAITVDPSCRAIIIRFPHPTGWIGLDRKAAEELRDNLTQKLLELRGITA